MFLMRAALMLIRIESENLVLLACFVLGACIGRRSLCYCQVQLLCAFWDIYVPEMRDPQGRFCKITIPATVSIVSMAEEEFGSSFLFYIKC